MSEPKSKKEDATAISVSGISRHVVSDAKVIAAKAGKSLSEWVSRLIEREVKRTQRD